MANDPACGNALADLMASVVTGDVPSKTAADIMSSATFIIMLKKDAATMEAPKR
jgi:hypothetical protein